MHRAIYHKITLDMKALYKEYLERNNTSIMRKTVIIERILAGGLVTYTYEITKYLEGTQTGRIENEQITNEELFLYLNEKIDKLDPEKQTEMPPFPEFDLDDPIVKEEWKFPLWLKGIAWAIGFAVGSVIYHSIVR